MAAIDRLNGLASEITLGIKAPCLVATTGANILLTGVQAVDGVTVGNNNERVLVKDQTDQTTNGIYIASTGNWVYAQDAAGIPTGPTARRFWWPAALPTPTRISARTPMRAPSSSEPRR